MFMDTAEPGKSNFAEAPEVLDPVDMVIALSKLIFSVPDSIMSFITKISQSIISLKTICKKWLYSFRHDLL